MELPQRARCAVSHPTMAYCLRQSRHLAAAGAEAEKIAATVDIPNDLHFQTARRRVREALTKAGVAKHIDDLVTKLLGG